MWKSKYPIRLDTNTHTNIDIELFAHADSDTTIYFTAAQLYLFTLTHNHIST